MTTKEKNDTKSLIVLRIAHHTIKSKKKIMMSGEKRKRIAGDVSVGRSPRRLKEEIQTMKFRVHDFANLEETRVCFLLSKLCSPKCSFIFKNKKIRIGIHDFSKGNRGYKNFLTRKEVLDKYLDEDGTLVISVDLQLAVYKEDEDVWYPEPLQEEPSLVQLYHNSESTSDVSFDVDGTVFYAHKTIISLRAAALFELAKNNNNNNKDDDNGDNGGGGDGNVISITNMESDTFERILEHVYTVKTIPEVKYDNDTATKLLIAADRLGCTTLKLYIESIIVDKLLTASNAATYLLLSDSHSCALLKEASMKLHESDAQTVVKSNDWSTVVESNRLLEELFKFMAVNKSHGGDTNCDEIENLDVSSLRTKLSTTNLDIDGSREMLVERLKEANSKK